MKGLTLLRKELTTLLKNYKLLIPFIAILCIPVLYSGSLIWSFWDPYGKLEELPVAVVNMDEGTQFNGKDLTVGDDFVEKLKDNKEFKWEFVSREKAENGLKQHDYYMAIEIPEGFSKRAATVLDETPQPMELKYIANESSNFISSQIGGKAIDKIKGEISQTLTKSYTESLFDNIKDLSSGLAKASEGASDVNEGVDSARGGAESLKENLEKLASSSITFTDNMETVSWGAKAISSNLNGLSDGLAKIKENHDKITAGASQSAEGAEKLSDGIAQSKEGLGALKAKTKEAEAGSEKLAEGSEKLSGSLAAISEKTNAAQAGSAQVTAGLTQLKNELAQSSLPDEQKQALVAKLAALEQGSSNVTGGLGQLAGGMEQASTGASDLSSGAKNLSDGLARLDSEGFTPLEGAQTQLLNGSSQLEAGLRELAKGSGTLGEKIGEAQGGASKLASGSSELTTGIGKLADGSKKLQEGSDALAQGSGELTDGLSKLSDGTGELSGKLSDAAKDSSEFQGDKKQADMFSDPVKLNKERIAKVDNYGTGIAPYFLSLGLFVGALLLTIVFPLREPVEVPRSAFSWFISKFGVLLMVGIVQALLVDSFLLYKIGLEVQSVPRFMIFSIIVSYTFLAIIQFLVTNFADPGRFIAIILLVLQLGSSAGTFPTELLPVALQRIHSWLPMTFAVNGFRAVISGGDYSYMWENALSMAMYIPIMIAGTFVYFKMKHKKQYAGAAESMAANS